ncbi:FAD-dependent oxidoreductase [Chitinophaga arvensicola]|uniref:Flavin containing amine oxidoreductase n=1 Tax=Chitinophaga arvensicola TaxID=29529 RepID=A0A1I0SBA3_9BACT|nr:NAD(P)/FAD-dependent oxidoreductase [Chitinophaga arvensicola]SEW53792.1 Flavin containing amine oxidoreductase [Chitinophaga arvensicola]
MNGENTRSNTLTRKDFLRYMALIAGGSITVGQYVACQNKTDRYAHITGKINGASAAIGHRIREGSFPVPEVTTYTDTLIVGSGIAGLAAARKLQQQGIDFKVLELEPTPGGNAGFGKNAYAAYPLGAHYLPLPNLQHTALLELLEEAGMLTGYDAAGLPIYRETDLCFDPEERLFIHDRWQEGLVPQFGVQAAALSEIQRFLAEMERLRQVKGADQLFAFDIPVANSSADPVYTALDQISMRTWLEQKGYHSEELHWYLDYCCRDDYGADAAAISAWAGIHYFAGRKGKAANAESSQVLTWPEGNGRLMQHLLQFSKESLLPNSLVYQVTPAGDKVQVDYLDVHQGITKRIVADHCILAVPQFVGRRLLPARPPAANFVYSPWLVANITLDNIPAGSGYPLCWDNVVYKGRSLGYVNAQQQNISQISPDKQVITWYLPLDHLDPVNSRKYALGLDHAHWVKLIADDLAIAHRHIHALIRRIDVQVWGHGMIRPHPGFLTSQERHAVQQSGHSNIFFAHSDLSGISIFEEAFYHGNKAAENVIARRRS